MDLNELYFRHQISTMRAASGSDASTRALHQDEANSVGRKIGWWQRLAGAAAAVQWEPRELANIGRLMGDAYVLESASR